jgi:hypothetical protein
MTNLTALDLPSRVFGTLKSLGVLTVEDLLAITGTDEERAALRVALDLSPRELDHLVSQGRSVAEVPKRRSVGFGAL